MTCIDFQAPLSAAHLIELAECLCGQVAKLCGDDLCWCGLYPGGQPSWDYCGGCEGDKCGMGYVTVVQVSPYTTLGVADVTVTKCDRPLQALVEVGVLRCVPVEESGLPDPEVMADISLLLMADMEAIRNTVACCFTGDSVLQGYEALPVQGGCVGGRWRAVIGLD